MENHDVKVNVNSNVHVIPAWQLASGLGRLDTPQINLFYHETAGPFHLYYVESFRLPSITSVIVK